jgi:5-enolpyruvylshikimate-3-phosphate synthase
MIKGLLESEDVLSTVNALRNMGVKIDHHKEEGMRTEGSRATAEYGELWYRDAFNGRCSGRAVVSVDVGWR